MLRRAEIDRLVASLVADEIGRARKRAVDFAVWGAWTPETTVDEDGVGADSLTRLEVVARVNEFFHLHESGVEDYLLVRRTLGDWSEIVAEGLKLAGERITFRSSGSTGAPKTATHSMADLTAEIDAVWERIGPRGRILSWTPPHHIYGFLFTALLAARRDRPVVEMRAKAPSLRAVADGDLLVATPFQWALCLKAGGVDAEDVVGLSAAAPASEDIWSGAASAGIRLVEIYGSSETAGVGLREAGDAPFELLPRWSRGPGDAQLRDAGGALIDAPDALDWEVDRRFRPAGRRDGVVQVGGVNVDPAMVRAVLQDIDWVEEAAVRLDENGADGGRLKAFLATRGAPPEEEALQRVVQHCAERLEGPARPASFRLGSDLPRNAMGKLADWT
ncbi:MAG: 4-coumarate--CoA ligase [Pseudomonadota bacterium]